MNVETFLGLIEVSEQHWLWKGSVNNKGYGSVWVPALWKKIQIHHVSYRIFVGPIPPRKELDHLCKIRRCIRPDHLEVVDVVFNRGNR